MCGNDFNFSILKKHYAGSPPLVRERLRKLRDARCCHRITPACAGTTICRSSKPDADWDHPRLCGNDYTYDSIKERYKGSPPLVRERPRRAGIWRSHRGITPACAGTTVYLRCFVGSFRDHPRLCGNDPPRPIRRYLALGSPPLVRERLAENVRGDD